MGKLSSFFEKVKTWKILFIYILIVMIGSYFNYKKDNGIVPDLFAALDVSSAVALALLAGVAYYQYSFEDSKRKRFLEQLEKVNTLDNKDVLLGIQFGGGNEYAMQEMIEFAKKIGINENLVTTERFGDSKNQVSKNDIEKLERYLKDEFMPMFTNADNIHLCISGVGVTFYTCADILSNWKPIIVYHRNRLGKYERWTTDKKHREKTEDTLRDI